LLGNSVILLARLELVRLLRRTRETYAPLGSPALAIEMAGCRSVVRYGGLVIQLLCEFSHINCRYGYLSLPP